MSSSIASIGTLNEDSYFLFFSVYSLVAMSLRMRDPTHSRKRGSWFIQAITFSLDEDGISIATCVYQGAMVLAKAASKSVRNPRWILRRLELVRSIPMVCS